MYTYVKPYQTEHFKCQVYLSKAVFIKENYLKCQYPKAPRVNSLFSRTFRVPSSLPSPVASIPDPSHVPQKIYFIVPSSLLPVFSHSSCDDVTVLITSVTAYERCNLSISYDIMKATPFCLCSAGNPVFQKTPRNSQEIFTESSNIRILVFIGKECMKVSDLLL